MTSTRDRIALLLANAAWLQARCKSRPSYSPVTSDDELREARLARWIRNAAREDPGAFEKRLTWDGWSVEEIRSILAGAPAASVDAPADAAPSGAFPIHILSGAIERFSNGVAGGACRSIPFEEIFDAFVTEASSHIPWDSHQPIGERARRSWEGNLGYCLSVFAANPFYTEFDRFRSASSVAGAYHRWVGDLRAGGLLQCFERMPVLAHIMCTMVRQWVDFAGDFLVHLKQDYELLQRELGAAGNVVDVAPGLSDRHCGGRTVVRVTFENGCACYYKPRNCEAESRWTRILECLNDTGKFLEFSTPAVIAAGDRGWVAEVPWTACDSSEEVARFHRRAGALLGLLYAIGATDCHPGNLIASGEHPVLIDMETLTTPRVRMAGPVSIETAFEAAWTRLRFDSVLATGMLPQSVSDDTSGLPVPAVNTPEGSADRCDEWVDINSDLMRRERLARKSGSQPNALMLHGSAVSSCDYAVPVAEGFEEMYRYLLAHRGDFPEPGGLAEVLRDVPFRMLYRPTRVYELVCQGMLQPARLRSGIDAGIELEVLSRALLHCDKRHPFWPIVAAEQQALGNLDIPIFHGNTSSDALTAEDGTAMPGFFVRSGVESIRSRIAGLSEHDLRTQSDYIRASLGRWSEDNPAGRVEAEVSRSTTASLLDAAAKIGHAIAISAIHGADGTACWIATEKEDGYRMALKPMGPDLYDGCAGPALFLSALANVTGDRRYRDLAMSAFRSLGLVLGSQSGAEWLGRSGIGGCFGAPSMAYALARGSVLLEDASLMMAAERALATVARTNLAAETRSNVFNGLAGAILSALAVHRLKPADHLLALASVCGRRLLELRSPASQGFRVWPIDGQLLTGLSYGAAGIAYALSLLAAAIGDTEFRDAAAEACACERSVYSVEEGNWPDFRGSSETTPFATKWCHGGPGIALCRIGGLAVLDTGEIRADIEAGLRVTLSAPPTPSDIVCCGEMGRAEVLLFAAERLGRPDLREAAERTAARTMASAQAAGGYRTIPNAGPCHADFHRGLAGIGYGLLRLAATHPLPCVLAWE